MMQQEMTSLQRVLTSLSHKEPDRVPFFLLLTMHGAKELKLPIEEYFSKAEYVAEGQIRLREKYRHDCYYPFFYAPIEIEAFGGSVIFTKNGPPNSGAPIICNKEDIEKLSTPDINDCECLKRVLQTIKIIKDEKGDEAPIIGVVMSPFSLPVMQMGFSNYFEIMLERPDLFEHLMRVNEEFCTTWANAQLNAGTTAICYFDPVSSPTITPRDLYLKTGFKIAKRTIAGINGPTATHLASGVGLPIIDDLQQTGTAVLGASNFEDLQELKNNCKGKLTVLGNLNGIEMRRWTSDQVEKTVKEAMRKAGPGGGFILSDCHGEIPFQVPDHVLSAISETVHKFGTYPINLKK